MPHSLGLAIFVRGKVFKPGSVTSLWRGYAHLIGKKTGYVRFHLLGLRPNRPAYPGILLLRFTLPGGMKGRAGPLRLHRNFKL